MSSIEVSHFKKSFENHVVHKDISFKLEEGECMGLIGGSGTGKSVLLRSLIGLEKADEGKVCVLGKDLIGADEDALLEIRKQVAYVFQEGALFDSMSVFENVAYPLKEHTNLSANEIQKKVEDVLEDFGVLEAKNLLKSELSGGMQKRVGLARSIILDPQIILYDEPTAGLDPKNINKIQELILKLKKRGKTSILVTHDMPTALEVCDKILLLDDGVIKASSDVDDLKNDPDHPIYRFIKGLEDETED